MPGRKKPEDRTPEEQRVVLDAERAVVIAAEQAARVVLVEAMSTAQTLTEAGKRRINVIWESTQAIIAVAVTLTTLLAAVTLVLKGEGGTAAFLLLSNAFFLVIGFYFGRTNHTRVGGVGGSGSGSGSGSGETR